MRLLAIALFAGLFGSGCGRYGFVDDKPDAVTVPIVPPPAGYQSGTRLRATIHEIGSAKRFVEWFDTQLGEECALYEAEDGVTRCLPSRVGFVAQYSDSTCATPLLLENVVVDSTDCPSANVLARVQVGERARVVQVGASYTGTVYQNTNGTCVMVGSSGIPFFSVGATVPPEMFVAFHDELTPSGDLAYIEHVGDDGSRVLDTTGLVHSATGEHCRLESLTHDETLCLPKEAGGGLIYADAACTERAVYTNEEPTPRIRVYANFDTCRYDALDATIGEELTGFYQLDGATQACIAGTLPATYRIFRVTSLDPAVSFATGVLDVPAGGRVVVASWKFTQGQSMPSGFYDTLHGDACIVTAVADTHERVCAPIWTGYTHVYSDTSCSTAISGIPRCAGAWRSQWYPTAPPQWTCDGPAEMIYAMDQPIAGPYYEKANGTCALADPTLVEPKGQNPALMPVSEMALVTRRFD